MRILLIGAPGSGKGTQAVLLARLLDVPAISTGDIFRANVADRTPLGVTAQKYMDAGEYVPDEVTNAMVRDRLAADDCGTGFILDGYPRTLAQVDELDAILGADGCRLDAVVEIEVDDHQLLDRLLRRAAMQGRADDTVDVIRRRQQVYREQTAPLADAYAARGIHRLVDGVGSPEDVGGRIAGALDAVLRSRSA